MGTINYSKVCKFCDKEFNKIPSIALKKWNIINYCSKECYRNSCRIKTHCKKGHELTPENTIIKDNKYKNCKICIKFNRMKPERKINESIYEKQRRKHLTEETKRNRHLKDTYKIDLKKYNQMFEEQQGCCRICNIHQSDLAKPLYIDHCHKQNVVRGLLCQHCNTMLGFAKDNIETLQKAIEYLKEFKEQEIYSLSD